MTKKKIVKKSVVSTREKTTVGWREYISLPDWGVKKLLAKIDTGANTSALDVSSLEELPHNRVRFVIRKSRQYVHRTQIVTARIVRRTTIKPSSGKQQERLVVQTDVKIGTVVKPIEISLVCRRNMICRMLIGRAALARDFIVDPGRVHLHKPKTKKKKKLINR